MNKSCAGCCCCGPNSTTPCGVTMSFTHSRVVNSHNLHDTHKRVAMVFMSCLLVLKSNVSAKRREYKISPFEIQSHFPHVAWPSQ